MKLTAPSSAVLPGSTPLQRARTPEEAAKQFEEVFVRQLTQAMTKGLFDTTLTGEDGPSWVGAYGEMQQGALAEHLAKHLVEGGTVRLSELLLRQWKRTGLYPEGVDGAAPAAPAAPAEPTPLPGDPSLQAA